MKNSVRVARVRAAMYLYIVIYPVLKISGYFMLYSKDSLVIKRPCLWHINHVVDGDKASYNSNQDSNCKDFAYKWRVQPFPSHMPDFAGYQ